MSRGQIHILIVFISFHMFGFLPDLYFLILGANGFVATHESGSVAKFTYTLLFDIGYNMSGLVLLLSYKKMVRHIDIIVPAFVCQLALQVWVLNATNHWLVFRSIELSREFFFIFILYKILRSVSQIYQRERFLWICFFASNLINFLIVFLKKVFPVLYHMSFAANSTSPVTVWIWLSAVFVVFFGLWVWILPIIGLSNISGEKFDYTKSGLLIKPARNSLKFTILDFILRKEGTCVMYFANNRNFYGIDKLISRFRQREIDPTKYIFLPINDLTEGQFKSLLRDVILKLIDKKFKKFSFTCWDAARAQLISATGQDENHLLGRYKR